MIPMRTNKPRRPILSAFWTATTAAGHDITGRAVDGQTEQIRRLAEVGYEAFVT